MHNTILTIFLVFAVSLNAGAQFHTISSGGNFGREINAMSTQNAYNKVSEEATELEDDTVAAINQKTLSTDTLIASVLKRNEKKSGNSPVKQMPLQGTEQRNGLLVDRHLPELTIPNLLAEIERNGIRYPKIVLAQAILETGWFRSSVCRNKHNLFGLTNPRTKTYYEFNHWTESVKAYYTKVQYRYKGGNYLLWLRDIGYAEDPGYIRAIIKVLKQL